MGDVPALGQHTAAILAELGLTGRLIRYLCRAILLTTPRPISLSRSRLRGSV